jgi:hypothetical protein
MDELPEQSKNEVNNSLEFLLEEIENMIEDLNQKSKQLFMKQY